MTRTTVRGGPGVRVAAAVSLALLVAGVSACGSPTTAPPTAKVQRGTVANMVSASGALAPVTSQNLGFSKGSKLVELNVRVGDVVKPGQLLAREDDFGFQQTLAKQKAALDGAQANLDKATNSPLADGTQRAADQAQVVYDKAQKVYDKTVDLTHKQLDQARKSYKIAAKTFNTARDTYEAACPNGSTPSPAVSEDPDSATDDSMSDASGSTGADSAASSTSGSGGLLGSMGGALTGCTAQAVSDYNMAKNTYVQARATYKTAKKQGDLAIANAQLSREAAQQTKIGAENTADVNNSDRPSLIASAAASVASAQADVAAAQRDVDNTLLYAPVGGTVSTITGTVGEYMASTSNGNTSALAPGSAAAIPGVGAAATSDASGNASSGLSATRPGGGAFISLNNLSTFQVVVPFEESDAAKVAPNQKVEVSFDAVPDLTRDGTVLSIAPSGTNISGVTNYYATILLTNTDPRLKAGQTAEASVMTNTLDNVLVVPNSAVIKQGNGSFVNTPGPDGKPVQTKFEPGMVGDNNTQVLSGLREGQEILLPQAQVAPTQK